MRLIDADELDKTIREEFHGISATGFICFMRNKTPIEVYNRVRDLIDSAPTVERPKGEWITKEYSIEYYCSNCGRTLDQYCENFCCYCGADMRGGKNETN